MVEVAYELKESATYLLASPNTVWAAFPYDNLLSTVKRESNGREIGAAWLQQLANPLRSEKYPFTLALLELDKLDALMQATANLADLLQAGLATDRPLIEAANLASDRYESLYDNNIDANDSYVDLYSFMQQLQEKFAPTTPIASAATAVQVALNSLVIQKDFEAGKPDPNSPSPWQWRQYGGLSIYLPGTSERAKQKYYTPGNLTWAAAATWDEFLQAYWPQSLLASAQVAEDLPTCASTTTCKELLANPLTEQSRIFLPIVQR